MALYEEYTSMDRFSSVAGSHMPVAITLSEPDYRVLEYWMPCDGISIKYVAVDITGIQESERVSFQKLFDLWSVSLDCKPLSMTSEELMQAGLLSATGFHEGLLFTFENASFDGETLTVGATKYRGPLGAAGADFTVRFNNGAWTVHESDMVYMTN